MQQLIQVLQEIQKRCGTHWGMLNGNEMLTRYCLIDPVLRALGWDTEDPDMVVPEFQTVSGCLDYVLRWKNKPYIAIEAKALGKVQEARKESVKCPPVGIEFFVATDGDFWELYKVSQQTTQQVFAVRIATPTPAALDDTAQQLLILHHALILHYGEIPISPTKAPSPTTTNGHSFADLKRNGFPVSKKNPSQVIFPDNTAVLVKQWKDVLIKVIEKLDRQGCLPPPDFKVGVRQRTILYSTDPDSVKKPYQKKPYSFFSEQYGTTIYIKTHGSAVDITSSIYQLLQAVSQNYGKLSPQNVCVVF
jgi:hypothetical protein